jgi:hypothetical protein
MSRLYVLNTSDFKVTFTGNLLLCVVLNFLVILLEKFKFLHNRIDYIIITKGLKDISEDQ